MSALQLGLKQADRNANDSISLVQTAEGALNEVGGIVAYVRELADSVGERRYHDTMERGYLQQEFNLLRSELDRIVNVTEYNGPQKLVDGSISSSATALDFQVGMNNTSNDRISLSLANTTSTGLSIDTDSLATASQAQAAITALDTALA